MSDCEDNFCNEEEYFDEDVEIFSDESNEENEDEENEEVEDEKSVDEFLEEIIDDEDITNDQDKIIEIEKDNTKKYYKNERKISLPILTKFEKAKLIGIRAIHISQGSLPIIPLKSLQTKNLDPLALAEMEFEKKMIPLIIRRHLPNGTFEDWRLEDFKNI